MRVGEGGTRSWHENMAGQRSGMDGKPGQCAHISMYALAPCREDTVYAGQEDDFVTFLVNSFDCLMRLKDPDEALTAPKTS